MSQSASQIQVVRSEYAFGVTGIDHLFIQARQTRDQFDCRAGLEAAPHAPLLIDDAINAASLGIHHDDGARVITQRVYRHASHFRIFARGNVTGNECLRLVAHRLVKRTLTSDRCPARGFCAASRGFEVATVPSFDASHLGGPLAFGQGTMKSPLQRLKRRGLLARDATSLSANLARRKSATATPTAPARG